ncbi:MAG: toprim domain-containing protein [Roseburia hominis]
MAKSLIITEKPSVAQEFARILGVSGRNDGYIENDGYVITWCVGHLVEMVYPEEYDERYKKWRLEDLPFLPRDYKYNVIPSVSRQYDVVHKMLHREDIDTVYWAGDAGKEGQTIEENIRKFGARAGMGLKEAPRLDQIRRPRRQRFCAASVRQKTCRSMTISQSRA